MLKFLRDLRKRVTIGMVGGSDLKRIMNGAELGEDGVNLFDYTFAIALRAQLLSPRAWSAPHPPRAAARAACSASPV